MPCAAGRTDPSESRRAVDIGCNCSGARDRRLQARSERQAAAQAALDAQRAATPSPPPNGSANTTASQNQRARTGAQQSFGLEPPQQTFTLQRRDGSTQSFGSRLEAEAERVRAGGGSII